MNRADHIEHLKEMLPAYLDKMGIDYENHKPFLCINPDHPDIHPSMYLDAGKDGVLRVHCYGCHCMYDLFDVIRIDNGIDINGDTFNLAYEMACKWAGESPVYDHKPPTVDQMFGKPLDFPNLNRAIGWDEDVPTPIQAPSNPASVPDAGSIDFMDRIEKAHEALLKNPDALAHFTQRGFSLATIKRFRFGYDKAGYNSFMQGTGFETKARKRIYYTYFIPYLAGDSCSYVVSEINDRSQIDGFNGKYRKLKGVPEQYFNESHVTGSFAPSETIFICEGAYDAISVEQAGGACMALIGAKNQNRLKKILQERDFLLCGPDELPVTFINALDNDKTGQEARKALNKLLSDLGYTVIEAPEMPYKDFNEYLMKDPAGFQKYIQEAQNMAKMGYEDGQNGNRIDSYLEEIERSKDAPSYPTGFQGLDDLLDGGLFAGLYTIGAVSSLGKTTFLCQIMDYIAKWGQDVMMFSLEMGALEVTAKSFSRLTALRSYVETGCFQHAKTTRSIMDGHKIVDFSERDKQVLEDCIKYDYRPYANNIRILAGMGVYTVADVKAEIQKHIKIRRKKPLVIIDYLQILQPLERGMTDKQSTDRNVLELKQMSRDLGVPIIVVSSLNRASYADPVNMSAFKESGAVEYTSDVLIGLQYKGMDYIAGEKDPDRKHRISELIKENEAIGKGPKMIQGPSGLWAKNLNPLTGKEKWGFQDIEIKILKNRNGSKGTADVCFIPAFNLFFEQGDPVQQATINIPKRYQTQYDPFTIFDDKEIEEKPKTKKGKKKKPVEGEVIA